MARLKQRLRCPLILLLALFSIFQTIVLASADTTTPQTPKLNTQPVAEIPIIIPTPPAINAKGYVLMDANSGNIIASSNMHERLPPASLTKLMTVYVASQALRQGQIHLSDQARVSTKAWQMGGSRMFLRLGSVISVQDLIRGIIIASGNDACVVLAEHMAGSEDSFANLMNQTAGRLGMHNTHFMDSTGLPNPDHYTTSYDLAVLTQHIINDFPEDYQWYKQKWIVFNNIKQPNRNRLLWRDPTVDGLKTGHTEEAGYCLIASAKRNGMRLISVVMGAPSDEARADDTQALLDWGYRFYETHKLFDAQQKLASARVWMGVQKQVDLALANPLYITIPRGQYKDLKASMQINPQLQAPVVKDQVYGQVQVTLKDKAIATAPLVALTNDPTGSLTTRLIDSVTQFISRII